MTADVAVKVYSCRPTDWLQLQLNHSFRLIHRLTHSGASKRALEQRRGSGAKIVLVPADQQAKLRDSDWEKQEGMKRGNNLYVF